jgi:hypothetical protein
MFTEDEKEAGASNKDDDAKGPAAAVFVVVFSRSCRKAEEASPSPPVGC